MLDKFRIITDQGNWHNEAKDLLEKKDFPPEFIEDFNTYWIEGGHRIREQLKDDAMLTKLLRAILPAYSGDKLNLYRGENIDRWEQYSIGYTGQAQLIKRVCLGKV
jgi:hypothetical protein